MNQWASKQIRQELLTGKAGLILGGTLTFLIFLILCAVNWLRGEMRVHPVSTAEEAAEAQSSGWVAETAYEDKTLLGSVVLETTSQGEISFIMGGAVAAVPGRQTTTEEEYRIWALDADGFTAILFTNRDDLPAGSLRMDSVIEWLTASDRAQLESEFSAEGQPAYVFLLEKEPGRWFELICAVLTLGGAAFAGWLLLTKRGLMTTKLWKSMAAAGDPDEILTDLNDPKYARSGFAVARKYVHVNGVVIPRAGMQCAALTDENGDIKLIFERADGWTTEYYPDEDEYQTLKSLLPIKE